MGNRVASRMISRGDNIIIPTVGGKPASVVKQIEGLRKAGYKIGVVHVDVNENEAARRMARRTLRTGRHISSSYVSSIGTGPKDTYNAIKRNYPDLGYAHIDANGPQRSEYYVEAKAIPGATAGRSVFGGK